MKIYLIITSLLLRDYSGCLSRKGYLYTVESVPASVNMRE